MEALAQAAPNARDYYVQAEPQTFYRAQEQHYARMTHLRLVYDELGEIAEAIYG
jgi:hypothetical protein